MSPFLRLIVGPGRRGDGLLNGGFAGRDDLLFNRIGMVGLRLSCGIGSGLRRQRIRDRLRWPGLPIEMAKHPAQPGSQLGLIDPGASGSVGRHQEKDGQAEDDDKEQHHEENNHCEPPVALGRGRSTLSVGHAAQIDAAATPGAHPHATEVTASAKFSVR